MPLHLSHYSPNVVKLMIRPHFPTRFCTWLYLLSVSQSIRLPVNPVQYDWLPNDPCRRSLDIGPLSFWSANSLKTKAAEEEPRRLILKSA